MLKKSFVLLSTTLSIGLYSCQSGSSGDSNTFTPVALQWESCNPEVYEGITEQMISTLGNRLSCSKMVVPMNYNDPQMGTIEIALSKVSAAIPAQHQGVIFFNPGGPGGSGLNLAPYFDMLWSIADENDPLGAKYKQISNTYDLIGFDPRGVGSSTQLVCEQLGNFYHPLNINESLISFDNQQTAYSNQSLTAQACNKNILTPYINTEATARDIDMARALLDESKINYIGYSYGTWLGTWYAGLFPNHVDKMVIDSNVNITVNQPTDGATQPPALQNIMDNIIAPYAALNDDIYNLGTTTEEIINIYYTLSYPLQSIVGSLLYPTLFSQAQASKTIEILMAAKEINQIIDNNPYITQEELITTIDAYVFSSDEEVNNNTIIIANQMIEMLFSGYKQIPEQVKTDDSDSTNNAVKCNDGPSPRDFDFWYALSNKLNTVSPIFGANNINETCTNQWPQIAVSQPSIDQMRQAPSILMVQTQYDGATPLEGAIVTYNQLNTASMVYVTNTYSHGVFATINNGCADLATADYILTGATPNNQLLVCEGEGLLPNMNAVSNSQLAQHNTSQLPVALANKASHGDKVNIDKTFKDSKQAQILKQQIQDLIINAELINHK